MLVLAQLAQPPAVCAHDGLGLGGDDQRARARPGRASTICSRERAPIVSASSSPSSTRTNRGGRLRRARAASSTSSVTFVSQSSTPRETEVQSTFAVGSGAAARREQVHLCVGVGGQQRAGDRLQGRRAAGAVGAGDQEVGVLEVDAEGFELVVAEAEDRRGAGCRAAGRRVRRRSGAGRSGGTRPSPKRSRRALGGGADRGQLALAGGVAADQARPGPRGCRDEAAAGRELDVLDGAMSRPSELYSSASAMRRISLRRDDPAERAGDRRPALGGDHEVDASGRLSATSRGITSTSSPRLMRSNAAWKPA